MATRNGVAKAAAVLLAISIAILPTPSNAQAAEPLRIMLMGDSLIQGYGSTGSTGIRPSLSRYLDDAGVPHIYTNAGSTHGGWTVQDLLAGVDGWMASDHPDVVLVMVGTNNAAGVAPGMAGFGDAYRALVDRITALDPNVRVVVGTVPYSNAYWSPNEVTVNVGVITKGFWHPSGRAYIAYTNRLHPCYLFDNVHPGDSGYAVLGGLWATGLLPALGKPAPELHDVLTDKRAGYERAATVPC